MQTAGRTKMRCRVHAVLRCNPATIPLWGCFAKVAAMPAKPPGDCPELRGDETLTCQGRICTSCYARIEHGRSDSHHRAAQPTTFSYFQTTREHEKVVGDFVPIFRKQEYPYGPRSHRARREIIATHQENSVFSVSLCAYRRALRCHQHILSAPQRQGTLKICWEVER